MCLSTSLRFDLGRPAAFRNAPDDFSGYFGGRKLAAHNQLAERAIHNLQCADFTANSGFLMLHVSNPVPFRPRPT